jgi:hypothetical protein
MQIIAQARADYRIEFQFHCLLPFEEMEAVGLDKGDYSLGKHGTRGLRAE